jgi:hypothetical protein
MYEGKWVVEITGELWRFDDLNELQKNLKEILELKDKFGRIK